MQNQEKLNQAVTAFELWRKKRIDSRENIPDELRHLAVQLLTIYSRGQITRALRICTTQLNSWRKQFSAEPTSVPEFVPLSIEVENRTSSQLSLTLILHNSTQIRMDGQISSDLLRTLIQEAGGRP